MVLKLMTKIVFALRLRYVAPLILLLAVVYLAVIHPWMKYWGSTAAEQVMALPGDDLYAPGTDLSTMALTINAAPDEIWPWLLQVGQDRAGFYTYTWLENLVGADIHNTDWINPVWQTLEVGDSWRLLAPDYLGGVGKDAASPVLRIEPDSFVVLEMFGAYVLQPVDALTTRLMIRGASSSDNLIMKMAVDPIVFTMGRRMLLGIKARAEGRPDVSATLMTMAHIGWVAAGLITAGLFISGRRRRFWLGLPLLAALPALLMAGDLQAALAVFLAVGIPLLGFLFFGRRWWGSLLVIASLILLTLLLAPEAWSVYGLAFLVIVIAALAALITNRAVQADHARSRVGAPVG